MQICDEAKAGIFPVGGTITMKVKGYFQDFEVC